MFNDITIYICSNIIPKRNVSGRDKQNPFIIVKVESEYVYLCDGDLRKLEKPKKKNIKHIQITHKIDYDIKNKLEDRAYILDADIRKALSAFAKEQKDA